LERLRVLLLLLVGMGDAVVPVDLGQQSLKLLWVGVELPTTRPVCERVDEFFGADGGEVM